MTPSEQVVPGYALRHNHRLSIPYRMAPTPPSYVFSLPSYEFQVILKGKGTTRALIPCKTASWCVKSPKLRKMTWLHHLCKNPRIFTNLWTLQLQTLWILRIYELYWPYELHSEVYELYRIYERMNTCILRNAKTSYVSGLLKDK